MAIMTRSVLRGVLCGLMLLAVGAGCRLKTPESSISPQVVEAMNRGVSLMGQYEYSQAVQAFEEAVKAAPELDEARINLAIALFNRGRKETQDMERATQLLNEILAKDAHNLRALYFKSIILQHLGQAEEAIVCLESVVQARPEDGAAHYLLGLCKLRIGQPGESNLLSAIRYRPNLYSAYYQLYQSALRKGETDKAREYMEKFKSLRESPLGESIELPQYNQMGDLALTLPLPSQSQSSPDAPSSYRSGPAQVLFTGQVASPSGRGSESAAARLSSPGGIAAGDLNGDGLADLVVTSSAPAKSGALTLLLSNTNGTWIDATSGFGLNTVTQAVSCAIGDFDNDNQPDILAVCADGLRLFQGQSNAPFAEVTPQLNVGSIAIHPRSAVFFDADHDADLDILVCNDGAGQSPTSTGSLLLNNNGDGSFSNITQQAGLLSPGDRSTLVLLGDLDNDRDADVVFLQEGGATKVFLNDLGGRFHAAEGLPEMRGDRGGALQDFNGDGELDLILLGGDPIRLQFYAGDGRGGFDTLAAFEECARAASSRGPWLGLRIADADWDGDLDLVLFGKNPVLLLNRGGGRFTMHAEVWPADSQAIAGAEWFDLTQDRIPDLICWSVDPILRLYPGIQNPALTAMVVQPTGMRGRDGRTRSPANGFGVKLLTRAGLFEQTLFHYGQTGSSSQSSLPIVIGMGGASKADFLRIQWPDGVAQVEIGLGAGENHKIAELQRKISSCPVLFAWNGQRFEFITDFAGVGGLGYYAGPGESAPPQVLEHIKIEPDQLRPQGGIYDLRITEPMEETAYVDRLELLAIDHPKTHQVFPDERLAVNGPAATHDLIVLSHPIFPLRATDPDCRDCTEHLLKVDRRYAYEPPLDRRYFGYCRPHTLEMDFGDQLAGIDAQQPVFLFIRGYIEYPYSQTVYAAAQSQVKWEPLRIDRQQSDGSWKTLVADAGVPGGMDRTMTVDLTGHLTGARCRLRLTSNLEVFFDQIFLANHVGRQSVRIRSVPLLSADLRRVGFAREYSPDGRLPLIYDYALSDATAPFHVLRGAYTRYGPVKTLLEQFDDQYVLVGPGDEIALRFDASSLPAVSPDASRSFVLISHAYCKDMDLYTATPDTLEPLPFRGMSRYPYPPTEHYPNTPEHQAFLKTYNTRIIK
ncbi:MAG TPA: FG-GAP-like repeat-containing protein [Verrucomicrobiota bacterium]|nr:FG-GAP-like repeat-containing protein [Verrucomicrobiota bacterium]